MIEQAIFVANNNGEFSCRGQSAGFAEEWLAPAEKVCLQFGTPRDGAACPGCVFALPCGRKHVAVVQAVGQGMDGAPPVAFRFLVLPKSLYADLEGDLFRIADAFPPTWDSWNNLPVLTWTAGAPPRRTVAEAQKILDVPYSATLLGGVQALLDGGKLVFERTGPDERLVRSLWALLPASNRCELWPTTFAFGNELGFDVAVVPRADGPEYAGYVTEVQAGDYPERRYELALQIAVESGNQRELDGLFARRTGRQTMRLGLLILALFMAVPLISFIIGPAPAPPPDPAPRATSAPKESAPQNKDKAEQKDH